MKATFACLILLAGAVAGAQEEEAVSSDSIIDGLIGDKQTRAILVRERRSPEGMSIDLTIEFDFGSSELTAKAKSQLKQLQQALVNEQLQPYSFEVVGHTDGKGDAGYNEQLSMTRATMVKDFLTAGGVAPERLVADGKGEHELLYPHLPNDNRNRRVEITNLGKIGE